MDGKNKKGMTPEEMGRDFKEKMFKALSQKTPGVHMDQDGFEFEENPSNNPLTLLSYHCNLH